MTEILAQVGMENLTTVIGYLMIFIGMSAFIVSVIVEGLKSFKKLDKLPTKLICYIVSVIITPVIFCAVMAWIKQPIEWFMVFASFLASFVVAKVSMNGWDDVTELAQKLIRL